MAQKSEIKVRKLKNELIKAFQDYCRSQVVLWRQVPELALRANKVRAFSCGQYGLAHNCLFWPVFADDIHGLHVNLRTGELNLPELLDRIQLGDLFSLLDRLRADKVINSLQAEIDSSGKDSK
ncbi:MAG: hypothetical protein HYT63_03795 [Candidatus Yanofskybacteria bacterium]|nr:hypothetical protein [Candidatus Yanofskybacteria bacterium]